MKVEATRNWKPRLATDADIPALEKLIPLSVRTLQAAHYSFEQMNAALGPVFGVDRQLIRDGTFFVVEEQGEIIACGGWSMRPAMFGSDNSRRAVDAKLEPLRDAARIRAFFVHPEWARRGLGRSILAFSERAICRAGFRSIELVATLSGVALYATAGYRVEKQYELTLEDGVRLPVVRMRKRLPEGDFPVDTRNDRR